MKFSKRAGVLLLAVGASAIAGQGAAAATPLTPGQVGAVEKGLAPETVPFTIPLDTVSRTIPLVPGGTVDGKLPASPVRPGVPDRGEGHHVIPDKLFPALDLGGVSPGADVKLPVPAVDDAARVGGVLLDAPSVPVHGSGPAVGLGHPLNFTEGPDGRFRDGELSFGDLDPRVIGAAVQTVPGAKAELGGDDKRISLTRTAEGLTTTGAATLAEAMRTEQG